MFPHGSLFNGGTVNPSEAKDEVEKVFRFSRMLPSGSSLVMIIIGTSVGVGAGFLSVGDWISSAKVTSYPAPPPDLTPMLTGSSSRFRMTGFSGSTSPLASSSLVGVNLLRVLASWEIRRTNEDDTTD